MSALDKYKYIDNVSLTKIEDGLKNVENIHYIYKLNRFSYQLKSSTS